MNSAQRKTTPGDSVEATRVAHTLERYTAIDSVNPSLTPGRGEAVLAEALADDLEKLGARVTFHEVTPGRANVLGHVEVSPELPTVTFDAHLDTVPLSDQATAHPRWEEDRLFARGACDDKASLAAMVEALRHVVTRPNPPNANVTLLGSVDEEVSCRGAEAAHDLVGSSDLIVVGEPTQLNVGTWHKGTTRFEIETFGRSSHSSMPQLGINAIELMTTVLSRLVEDVIPALREIRHPSGEPVTVNIGAITGGGPLNQVPDRCRVGIDVRRIPGQPTAAILDRFDAAIRELVERGAAVRHPPTVDSPAFETSCSEPMLDGILALARAHGASSTSVGLPHGTNASRLARSGAPTIVVGPGSIELAHTDDEHVELAETVRAANLFVGIVDHLPQLVSHPRTVRAAHQAGATRATRKVGAIVEPTSVTPGRDGDNTSSVTRAYRHIRQAIVSGRYPPNSPLRLQRIADEAEVSMIPVREALRTLEAERLVRTVPNRGAIVAELSLDDVRDAYKVRILLETEALRQSYEHLTPDDLAEARSLADHQRSLRGQQDDEASKAHRQLHFVLYRKCGSAWLLRFIDNLWDHTERYRRIAQPTRGPSAQVAGEHLAVLDAIEEGDVDHAVAALRDHLMNTVRTLEASHHSEHDPDNARTP